MKAIVIACAEADVKGISTEKPIAGVLAEVIDKGQPPRLGRIVGKIKGGIDA